MKLFLKVLRFTAILVLPVIVVLFLVSLLMQNRGTEIILKSLNNNFSTKIEAESYRLSLLKKFPRATIELKNVIVYSSPDFDISGFAGINTDTLLAAKSAFIDFKMTDLLKGDYTFISISVRSGNLNLFTDKTGRDNYDVSQEENQKDREKISSLNLNRINLSDIRIVYNDLRAGLIIKSQVKQSRMKSRISGDNIDFESNSGMIIEFFQLGNLVIRQNIPAELDAGVSKNEKGIFFKKSTLSVETWDFILTGFIASDNYLDLNVSGKNIDISKITNYIPDKYKNLVTGYHPSGILKLESTIKGVSSNVQDPHYEVSWSLKDANINYSKSRLKVDNFSFDGFYSNGSKNRPETSTFSITNFTTKLGSAEYRGTFKVTDFTKPRAGLTFSGVLYPGELREFLNLKNVESAGGTIKLDLKFDGYPLKKDSYKFSDLSGFTSHSEIVFNSFRIRLNKEQIDLRDCNGALLFNEKTTASNFNLIYNDQIFTVGGSFDNFTEWITGKPVILTGNASIKGTCIKPENFLKTAQGSNKEQDAGTKATVNLPANVNINADFYFDSLIYKTFRAEKINGAMSIQPKMVNIRNVNLNSQGGSIAGNGLIIQNRNKSFIGRGSFAISEIDINETFTTFNNFGQNFLVAGNINGTLSGSLSLLIPADSMLKPDIKSITAEGKYILTKGALINFEPVKELSSFIELSELENIKFDNLENDFFIRSNSLYIPQMDVRSSAADLSVNGKHSFTNDYEYHVRILLSELLSNKARKTRSSSSEFGEVEDDGLGRTSLLLKIVGKGEDIKVTYDMKAAGNQIKADIKKERQTLKNILNEEYGWYKGESEPGKKEATKPRFRVSWEGSDTSDYETLPVPEKKESIINRLFKKK